MLRIKCRTGMKLPQGDAGIRRIIVLFCAEEAVACVAQARQNISVRVEFSVKSGNVNLNVGVRQRNLFHPLGSTDYSHEFYIFTTPLFKCV